MLEVKPKTLVLLADEQEIMVVHALVDMEVAHKALDVLQILQMDDLKDDVLPELDLIFLLDFEHKDSQRISQ